MGVRAARVDKAAAAGGGRIVEIYMPPLCGIIPFGPANAEHAPGSCCGRAGKADTAAVPSIEEVVHFCYEVLRLARIFYDARATDRERRARHDSNCKRACTGIEYDAVNLCVGEDRRNACVRDIKSSYIVRSVGNGRRYPVRSVVPIAIAGIEQPGSAASVNVERESYSQENQ